MKLNKEEKEILDKAFGYRLMFLGDVLFEKETTKGQQFITDLMLKNIRVAEKIGVSSTTTNEWKQNYGFDK